MMRNPYKREDVFVCHHEAHRGFGHTVSAYHVLVEKNCFPEGCLEFRWRCQRLGKGGACPKGYKHVGTNCNHCRFYDEEKVQHLPELQLSDAAYRAFLDECREFDEWLEDRHGRILEVGGTVSSVRPRLVREEDGRRSRLRLLGFLVRLCPSFAGRQGFADPIFLRISGGQQRRFRLAEGDRMEAEGEIHLSRGRLVVAHPRRIYIEERGGQPAAEWEQALLDRVGAVRLDGQPERCLHCERGALVDVEDLTQRRNGRRREVLCLEGIGRPEDCPYEALRAMRAAGAGSPAAGRSSGRNMPQARS